jgi:HEAT repeat protein
MDVKTLAKIPPWEWPDGTDTALLDILRDGRASASDRLVAAELAGDVTVINDEIVAALLATLQSRDESQKLRGQAAISLGPVLEYADTEEFDDPDSVPIAEPTFHKIQESLRKLYMDAGVPKDVRRRILEAAVRAPQDWQRDAIRAAYASDDEAWRLTAVFCMRFVRGFDQQILEALESGNPDIHYEAVCAAGNWEVEGAWPHVVALVTSGRPEKRLLLAAIEAVGTIRPREAADILDDLADSSDEDIADAVSEALAMAAGLAGEGDEEDEDGESRP